MSLGYGQCLMLLVSSVDIVDDFIKGSALNEIKQYLSKHLRIEFFTFHTSDTVNHQPGLRTSEWIPGGEKATFTIRDNQGNYQGQVSLAYDKAKPLWIVSSDKRPLNLSSSYIDFWSEVLTEEIPKYVKRNSLESRTSIIVPMTDEDNKIFGIINFESVDYLHSSSFLKEELQLITNSISKLYLLNRIYIKQREETRNAIQLICQVREKLLPKPLPDDFDPRPKIFLASSSRAENDVMGEINDILDGIKNFKFVPWTEMSSPGTISKQIVETISTCQYGICYFSEPIDSNDVSGLISYRDNPNVLIEAGMFFGKSGDFDNLIIIREDNSGRIPFDVADTRLLIVSRRANKTLNRERFKDRLLSMLQHWLPSISGSHF